MKQIKSILILLIILFCAKCAFTQNTRNAEPPTTLSKNEVGNFIYDTVVNVAGVSKKELYTRAKNWIITTVRTSDNTVQFNDTSFSEIRTDMTIALSKYKGNYINFKISLLIKDNRYRFVCESFMRHLIDPSMMKVENFEKLAMISGKKALYKDFDKSFDALKYSLINSMSKAINSNW